MQSSSRILKQKLVQISVFVLFSGAVLAIPKDVFAGSNDPLPFGASTASYEVETNPTTLQECVQARLDDGETCFVDWDGHGRIKMPEVKKPSRPSSSVAVPRVSFFGLEKLFDFSPRSDR